jgi:branched-chain amino acid aminotransferase/4-amino-4-deoxychorismate lyase
VIPADDRGLTLGDGLFETLLARDGVFDRLDEHLDRLLAGCAALELPAPDRSAAQGELSRAVAQAGLQNGLAAVRLTLTAGSGGRGLDRPAEVRTRMFAAASLYQRPVGPLRMVTATIRRNADSPTARLKTLGYLDNVLARRAAQACGADEALMLNTRGEIACATLANVFWDAGGRLFTPALSCGILAGVTRAAVIDAAAALGAPVEEVAAKPGDLGAVGAMALTNSLIGLRQVSAWDGRTFGPSRLFEALAGRLA